MRSITHIVQIYVCFFIFVLYFNVLAYYPHILSTSGEELIIPTKDLEEKKRNGKSYG